MADSAKEDAGGGTIKCPNPDCGEDVDLKDDGTVPKYCEDCGADLSVVPEMSACPECKTTRRRKKDGTYRRICGECRYDYSKGEANTSSMQRSLTHSNQTLVTPEQPAEEISMDTAVETERASAENQHQLEPQMMELKNATTAAGENIHKYHHVEISGTLDNANQTDQPQQQQQQALQQQQHHQSGMEPNQATNIQNQQQQANQQVTEAPLEHQNRGGHVAILIDQYEHPDQSSMTATNAETGQGGEAKTYADATKQNVPSQSNSTNEKTPEESPTTLETQFKEAHKQFKTLAEDMESLSVKKRGVFSNKEEKCVKDALKKAENIWKSYENTCKSITNAKTDLDRAQKQERLVSCNNAFTNFIMDWSEHLHVLSAKLTMPAQKLSSIDPGSKGLYETDEQRTYARKVKFRAVLSKSAEDALKGAVKFQIQVRGRTKNSEAWDACFACLEKKGKNKYEGICKPNVLRTRDSEFSYKYAVVSEDKNKKKHTWWEVLYKTDTIRQIKFKEHEQFTVVHDGAIIIKEKNSLVKNVASKGIVAGIHDYMFPEGTSALDERMQGYMHMLSYWMQEMENGMPLEQLTALMEDIISRQSSAHTDFRYPNPSSIPFRIVEILKEYMIAEISNHSEALQSAETRIRPTLAWVRLLGFIHISGLYILNSHDHKMFYNALTTVTVETMNWLTDKISGDFTRNLSELMEKSSEKFKSQLGGSIWKLMQISSEDKEQTHWVYLIPLYQRTFNVSKESRGKEVRTPDWWGTHGYNGCVQTLKTFSRRPEDWALYLQWIKPFFQVCDMLPTTFLALLTDLQFIDILKADWEILSLFDVEAVLACAEYHIKRQQKTHIRKTMLYDGVLGFLRQVTCLVSVDMQLCLALTSTLVQQFPSEITSGENPVITWSGVNTAIQIYLSVISMKIIKDGQPEVTGELGMNLIEFSDEFQRYIYNTRVYPLFEATEIELWCQLFNCESISEHRVKMWWTSKCKDSYSARLRKLRTPDDVLRTYFKGENRNKDMDEAVTDYIIKHISKWIETGKMEHLSNSNIPREQLCSAIDQIVADRSGGHQVRDDAMSIVVNMLQWGGFMTLWTTFQHLVDEFGRDCVTKRTYDTLTDSVTAYERVVQQLLEADMSIDQFELQLLPLKETILKVCSISTFGSRLDDVELAFKKRETELRLYLSFISEFNELWQSCKEYFPAKPAIDTWLGKPSTDVFFNERVDSLSQKVVCEVIPGEVHDVITKFSQYRSQRIFMDIFLTSLEGIDNWDAVVGAFKTCMDEYKHLIQTLNEGTMDVTALTGLKQRYFNGNKDELLHELPELVTDQEICKRRTAEINILIELDEYYEGAQIMLKMKEMFQLDGDFTDLEKIVKAKEKTLTLGSVSDKLIASARQLREITQQRQQCLKAFLDCSKFVEWVRADVAKNEVNIFVNLARSAMEEDDLAADKARYLHAALTGYTPLLYDMEEKHMSYSSFIQLCERVWKVLDRNSELPENLKTSARELEFYRKVKTHYQNVEMHSISQAKAINATGTYFVGKIIDYTKDFKTLDSIVKLECEVESGNVTRKRYYTYSEIRSLQSKLTLVAGVNQRANMAIIQHFDEMRDAIENLGNAYIDIRREGCIQFDDLLVVVHCDPKHGTAVEIRLQSVHKKMYGQSRERSALQHTQDLYAYLNNCAEEWRASMDKTRSMSYELNFFTTEQLVVLRKELGLFSSSGATESLDKAIPMLAMVHSMEPKDILEILRDYEREEEKQKIEVDNEGFKTYQEMESDERDIVDYVREELEVDQHVAVIAFNEIGEDAFNIDILMKWNSDRLNSLELNRERGETSEDLVRKIVQTTGIVQLIPQLTNLWEKFIALTTGSIKNFLGIPHLSFLLQKLKEKSESKTQPQRRLPDWLYRGKPLLIAVPDEDTYKMVLTIYQAADENSPKPTRNDVLVCNDRTRPQDVTLFLNRALNDELSYYCMVNCHLLRFEVCREIENRLANMADNVTADFGLAFIYSSRAKDARIKAYLDKNLVRNPVIAQQSHLAAYVARITKHSLTETRSASEVDTSRSKVRLIRSKRAGVGKSLQRDNLCGKLRHEINLIGNEITIPVYRNINTDVISARLMKMLGNGYGNTYDVIHLDIAHEVDAGVDELLFNLVILGSVVNSEGSVWQARDTQYYIVECMPCSKKDGSSVHEVLDLLPTTTCIAPLEALKSYRDRKPCDSFIGFDPKVLHQPPWQNVLRYLEAQKEKKTEINYEKSIDSPLHALQLLTSSCGIQDPTWLELCHYVHFLSDQLTKVENSPFCASEDLPGFRNLVIRFMLSMAQDFGTRSLKIAEETPGKHLEIHGDGGNVLDDLSMKKTWEASNYPYLFFNEDGTSVTPLGFRLKSDGRNRYDLGGYKLTGNLVQALKVNGLRLSDDFDSLPTRAEKLGKLRNIMVKNVQYGERRIVKGKVDFVTKPMFQPGDDPDPNYVLTMDNAKKIIAIHQRLRVNVPVIIMGETGCGKTKLIDFMSKLQIPTELKDMLKTMVIVKIHGGTTEQDIKESVTDAEKLAKRNREICQDFADKHDSKLAPNVYTILFLDEANTTEAIGLVKEILCDGRMDGNPLARDTGLKIVAACNPYRRHSNAMIEKLQQAGLGYNVDDSLTKDRLGHIPMRHLVYRVQALPQSLLPLVWDFGTLNKEREYIVEMITKTCENATPEDIRFNGATRRALANILCDSQSFMRRQKDECSFVSLRDVARLLDVTNWFYKHRDDLFVGMDRQIRCGTPPAAVIQTVYLSPEKRSVLLAIGVCYLARLENKTRVAYSKQISQTITSLLDVGDVDGGKSLMDQVELCQNFFVEGVVDDLMHKNIAKNRALKENVFMMIVCIENRIPLFVVGKPGSSKSLSKALVMDAMKGETAGSGIFKRLKETYTESFQCSRHATAADIVEVFRTCASYQQNQQDLSKFVSVVVLDEVGLAEDSENMPLKALHPLLEDGSEGTPATKCAFIGISNWALDPAKMNRGIFVQRGTPATNELEQIAKEICKSDRSTGGMVTGYIKPLAEAYLKICQAKKPEERDVTEFFGLRDFYSLMKMVVNFAKSTKGNLNRNQLEHSILRNFGGFDPQEFDPMKLFTRCCPALGNLKPSQNRKPPVDPIELIKSTLSGSETALQGMESRYLLILTENLSVLNLVLNEFDTEAEVVFGSRFKDDVSYTQVCHNIFRIKMCMDKGTPVILLNLDDLYESLYDALNQYFTYLGNKKYVDLGLGTHRVKAFVAEGFRLVVIADKNKVLSQFPIPLINRLEKHYVSASTMLSADQRKVQADLEDWMQDFVTSEKDSNESCPMFCEGCKCEVLNQPYKMPCHSHYIGICCKERIFRENLPQKCPVKDCKSVTEIEEWMIDKLALENRQYFENSTVENCFIGYSSEATALVVKMATSQVFKGFDKFDDMNEANFEVLERSKAYMIQIATAESVLRLDKTLLKEEAKAIQQIYISEQSHETLLEYIECELGRLDVKEDRRQLMQVTSFAEVMTKTDVEMLSDHLNADDERYTLATHYLKEFQKESQFTKTISSFYNRGSEKDSRMGILIIQCEAANDCIELLDSVRYIIQRETKQSKDINHTVLLLSLSRGRPFNGYQGGDWSCIHIDDPRPPKFLLPSLQKCLKIRPSDLIAGQLAILEHPDFLAADDDDEQYDDLPPLEGDDDAPAPEGNVPVAQEAEDYELQHIEETPVRHIKSTGINIMPFIEYCLPAAMSRIKCTRSLSTFNLLKELLQQDIDFLRHFLSHVYKLLKEEEEYSSHWIKADAAKASHMKKSETLRHAVEDALERAFIPAIAAVTAFVGTQSNLQLLREGRSSMKALWNDIFSTCNTEGLSFEDITKGAASKLPESYYIESDVSSNQYPFSVTVKRAIDRFVKLPQNASIVKDADGRWLTGPLRQTPLGRVILKDDSEVQGYIADFLHIECPTHTDTEHKLTLRLIQSGLERHYPDGATLAHVHMVYGFLREHLINMSEVFCLRISKCQDTLVEKVLEKIEEEENQHLRGLQEIPNLDEATRLTEGEKSPVQAGPLEDIKNDDGLVLQEVELIVDHPMPEPSTPCDLLALEALIEDISQVTLSDMQTKPERWVNGVDQAKSLMERILKSGNDFSERRDAVYRKWCRLELQKLYAEHVIIPGPVREGKRQSCKILPFMKAIKGSDFQRMEIFDQIVSALRMVVRHGINSLYSDCPQDCPTCGKPLDSPAKLPCGHILCDVCSKQNQTCPASDCAKDIPEGFEYIPTEDDINLQMPLEKLTTCLREIVGKVTVTSIPTVQLLTAAARSQCILQQCVDNLRTVSLEYIADDPLVLGLREILHSAEEVDNNQISYYMMRQMLVTDGENRIKDMINTPMRFLVPTNVQESMKSFTTPDIFLALGGNGYQQAKSAVDNIISESATDAGLTTALNACIKAYESEGRILLHALFAQVTRTFNHDVPVSEKIRSMMTEYLKESTAVPLTKAMGDMLLTNTEICPELRIDQAKGINMMLLVLNTLTCFQHGTHTALLHPLTELITDPNNAKDHFFPTMEDNKYELILEEQRKFHAAGKKEEGYNGPLSTTTIYICPNGHIYFIGNCGRPIPGEKKTKCPDCGSTIGGAGYDKAAGGNTKISKEDEALKTQPGYILGSPGSRGVPAPHRDLSMLSCAVMRCLTHLFMFTSALFNKEQVYDMIKPQLESPDKVTSFLEGHIQIDLQHIAACCDESTENCMLLIHELLNRICNEKQVAGEPKILRTISLRAEWETHFDKKYITPLFIRQERDTVLQRIKTTLANNRPVSLDKILSTTNQPLNAENILASPGLWAYRRPLTLTSVINQINSSDQSFPNLLAMVKSCDILTAVRYLPDILNLMRHICKTFHSKYSRMNARQIKISELCKQPHIRKWIQSYVKAWNIAIHSVNFNSSGTIVELRDDPYLSDLLPDKHATMFAANKSNPRRLIDHLVIVHNGMLMDDRPSIRLREVTSYSVINLGSKSALLGVISSHVEYRLNADTKEQIPDYNLQAAERDVTLRYLGQRSKIKVETDDLPSYMFHEDFNVLNQIQALSETQERLSTEQSAAIINSVGRTVQTLTSYIKDLMTIISYLTVMRSVDMTQPLTTFMKNTLERKKVPNYLKADIQLKHVQNVWILLKFTQTDSFMRNGQEPFNDVDAEYNEKMSQQLDTELRKICVYNSPRTRVLMEELFEYITIRLNKSVTANQLKADDVADNLQFALEGFIAVDYDRYNRIKEDLPQLPPDLKVKHAPQAWQCIWSRYTSSKQASLETTV